VIISHNDPFVLQQILFSFYFISLSTVFIQFGTGLDFDIIMDVFSHMKAQINPNYVKILIFQPATHRVFIWPIKTCLLVLFRGKALHIVGSR